LRCLDQTTSYFIPDSLAVGFIATVSGYFEFIVNINLVVFTTIATTVVGITLDSHINSCSNLQIAYQKFSL